MAEEKKEKELTEQELMAQAQKLHIEKIQKATKEIEEVLNKYNLTMRVVHNIEVIPKER